MSVSGGFLSGLDITVPTLVLDENKVKENIRRMAEKAKKAGVRLRPHTKTHQSAEIAGWYRDYGIDGITVSSLTMAEYFADHGWDDITVAFPANILEIETINRLGKEISLGLIVDSMETVQFLESNLTAPVNVWVKIDVGYGRAGILWDETEEVVELAKKVAGSKIMKFAGLLTHAGHSYDAYSRKDLRLIHNLQTEALSDLKSALEKQGITDCRISIGDTPTSSIFKEFPGVDEIRPGNFVFYDLAQCIIGSCRYDDIAIAIACPVVSVFPKGKRKIVLIYGGSVHFSKDYLYLGKKKELFGDLVLPAEKGWNIIKEDAYLFSLSQEHGRLEVPAGMIDDISIGDVLLFLPVHSCLAARMHPHYLTTDGRKITRLY